MRLNSADRTRCAYSIGLLGVESFSVGFTFAQMQDWQGEFEFHWFVAFTYVKSMNPSLLPVSVEKVKYLELYHYFFFFFNVIIKLSLFLNEY